MVVTFGIAIQLYGRQISMVPDGIKEGQTGKMENFVKQKIGRVKNDENLLDV